MKAYFKRIFLLGGLYLLALFLSCLFNGWLFALVLYIITAVFIISLFHLLFNNVPDFLRRLREKSPGLTVCLTAIGWYPYLAVSLATLIFLGLNTEETVIGNLLYALAGFVVLHTIDLLILIHVLFITSLIGAGIYNYRRQKEEGKN